MSKETAGRRSIDFLVMEYVVGETLSDRLSAGPLPETEIVRLGLQLARGLTAAHEQGIIHCDLKPANVKLTADGRLKILDFGLAKLVQLPNDATEKLSTTGTRSLVGTLPYMAPEQLRGERLDACTDIWAAGVMLYQMATGCRPFPDALSARLLNAILAEAPAPPSAVNKAVSRGLESIIIRCLEKDPRHRYQSADELAADLNRLLTTSSTVTVRPASRTPSKHALGLEVAVSAALLLVVVFVIKLVGWHSSQTDAASPTQSLAVLPLRNLSGDSSQDYFADGMTDALINDLCKVSALRVISFTSVLQYKEALKPLPVIARELGVNILVEGSVLRSGNRVRINAKLVRAPTEHQLWAESYERNLEDVLALQSEMASTIAGAVQARVTSEDQGRLTAPRPVNPEAYDAYLLGRHYGRTGYAGKVDLQRAIEQLRRATALDPTFALAYAAIAEAYCAEAYLGGVAPGEVALPALEAATRAVALDESLAEAHTALGVVRILLHWDWVGAESAFSQALVLNPNSWITLMWYNWFLVQSCRTRESLEIARRLSRDFPRSVESRYMAGWTFLYAQRYNDAIAELEMALDIDRNAYVARAYLAAAFAFKGEQQQAIAQADSVKDSEYWVEAVVGHVYATCGRQETAREILAKLGDFEKKHFVDPYYLAVLEGGLGDAEQAVLSLQRALERRSAVLVCVKADSLWFGGAFRDARYAEILRAVGLANGR